MSSLKHEGSSGSNAESNAKEMAQMIRGYWISQIVGTLAQLGIPDQLACGALGAVELARAIDCDAEATYRLLRAAKVCS